MSLNSKTLALFTYHYLGENSFLCFDMIWSFIVTVPIFYLKMSGSGTTAQIFRNYYTVRTK